MAASVREALALRVPGGPAEQITTLGILSEAQGVQPSF
jgi:hypothetical protein